MRPELYFGPGQASYDHVRHVNVPPAPDGAMNDWQMGSPHPNAMPSLFADGTVRSVSYSIDETNWSYLWAWNDGLTITNLP